MCYIMFFKKCLFNLFFDFIGNFRTFKIFFLNVFFGLFCISIKYTYGKCQQIYGKTWFQDKRVVRDLKCSKVISLKLLKA